MESFNFSEIAAKVRTLVEEQGTDLQQNNIDLIAESARGVDVQSYRMRILTELYRLDGRADPNHPYHGSSQGCGRPFYRLSELEDLVSSLLVRVKDLELALEKATGSDVECTYQDDPDRYYELYKSPDC